MKLNEILTASDNLRLLRALLTSKGFSVRGAVYRGRPCLMIDIPNSTKHGRVYFTDAETWSSSIIKGQGHKLANLLASNEQDVIDFFNKHLRPVMPVTEEQHDSMILNLIQTLLDKGEKIYLDAHGKTERTGKLGQTKKYRAAAKGRILHVKQEHLVYDFNPERDPKMNVISHSFFMLQQPVDEQYDLVKIRDGKYADSYTLVDNREAE